MYLKQLICFLVFLISLNSYAVKQSHIEQTIHSTKYKQGTRNNIILPWNDNIDKRDYSTTTHLSFSKKQMAKEANLHKRYSPNGEKKGLYNFTPHKDEDTKDSHHEITSFVKLTKNKLPIDIYNDYIDENPNSPMSNHIIRQKKFLKQMNKCYVKERHINKSNKGPWHNSYNIMIPIIPLAH